MNDSFPTKEERVWRDGLVALSNSSFSNIENKIENLRVQIAAAMDASDAKAQAANDALERLLEANIASMKALAVARFDAFQQTVSRIEQQVAQGMEAASLTVQAVEGRSDMRHRSVGDAIQACEEKMMERVRSLKALIDLRSEMNEVAIGKAEQSNERRFESVNEFRAALSDQATKFVTVNVLDAKFGETAAAREALANQLRIAGDQAITHRADLAARLASLEGKLYVGGGSIIILITVLQLALNFFRHTGS